ncbi:SDR family NAD(P)-dependent oxidoreductase [Paenibacillus spongiae]|uniref:Glucose 1-dehydrogenase n=1 Tax=Paenibacillus spongiae TaxID=2909671 RepID=A0ABY5S4Y9_9BACL|nr:glucose 1-dehydrogenase [Paenibacillus spongiae]UVI28967.1 glucose 1-dehydrogenase [Paenibacillus spongiae]
MDASEFAGKVAVVTGGTKGIGFGAARRLAQGGASVLMCGIDQMECDQAANSLRAEGVEASAFCADVRHSDQVRQLMEQAVILYGGIDILVNSAGVQRYGDVVDTPEEVWDEVIDTNLKGIFLACKHALPEMRKRSGGSVVNVSSVQAFASQKGVAAYTASKGAINAMTRAMALDHAGENIRFNAVCPASVDTPMLRWAADGFKEDKTVNQMIDSWGQMHPLHRVAKIEEVAELIAFLASSRASFITGGEYKIDGGMTAALGVHLPE